MNVRGARESAVQIGPIHETQIDGDTHTSAIPEICTLRVRGGQRGSLGWRIRIALGAVERTTRITRPPPGGNEVELTTGRSGRGVELRTWVRGETILRG